MPDVWIALPAIAQDVILSAGLLAVPCLLALILFRGYAPAPLIAAHMRREPALTAAFVMLVAVAVGLGAAITAQERGLRAGTAAAADGFDLVIAAPGSELTAMLSTVFLQPADVPLLDGETFAEIHDHPRVSLAAPLAFGDSHDGAPVIGTTAEFVTHLAGDLAEGRFWATSSEALAGAATGLEPGATFFPDHGFGDAAQQDAHGNEITVVGTLPRTGTPWDGAVLVPVESVWETHGLANGHAPGGDPGRLGPPFDAAHFPGTPAIVVQPDSLAAAYGLRSEFTRDRATMAFFPGEVLSRLYVVMGDVRQAMSLMGTVTQLLVAGAVLLALAILARLHRRRTAMLRALGAPARFVMAVTWGHAAAILTAGTASGLVLGLAAASLLSGIVSERTGISVSATLGWTELHLALAFLALASLAALLPGWRATRSPITPALRA